MISIYLISPSYQIQSWALDSISQLWFSNFKNEDFDFSISKKLFQWNLFLYPRFFSFQIKICIVVCITRAITITILKFVLDYKWNIMITLISILSLDIEYKWNITDIIACYSFFPPPKTAPRKSEPEREKVRTLKNIILHFPICYPPFSWKWNPNHSLTEQSKLEIGQCLVCPLFIFIHLLPCNSSNPRSFSSQFLQLFHHPSGILYKLEWCIWPLKSLWSPQ